MSIKIVFTDESIELCEKLGFPKKSLHNLFVSKDEKGNEYLRPLLIDLTYQRALVFQENNDKNRIVSQSRISKIVTDLKETRWRLTYDCIISAVDGNTYNGGGRTRARVRAGEYLEYEPQIFFVPNVDFEAAQMADRHTKKTDQHLASIGEGRWKPSKPMMTIVAYWGWIDSDFPSPYGKQDIGLPVKVELLKTYRHELEAFDGVLKRYSYTGTAKREVLPILFLLWMMDTEICSDFMEEFYGASDDNSVYGDLRSRIVSPNHPETLHKANFDRIANEVLEKVYMFYMSAKYDMVIEFAEDEELDLEMALIELQSEVI